jgi:menaquinone-specific isochorismate synthase
MHLATEVTGTLKSAMSALDVAGVVHPSAAVCGTPSDRAAELITELEGLDRGRYAGPVGWVDAEGNGQFAIALRSGQLSLDRCSVRLFAGGGIVDGSVPNEELAETAQKFLPMYQALSPVARP